MSIEAMKHYEAALLEAFPRGATGDVFEHWNKARQAIAEAEKQEPVAWMYDFLNTDNRDEVIRNWTTQDYADIEREKGFNVRPLYTHPPKRQWVGLTDEEIEQGYETTGHYQTLRPQDRFAVFALARAIEAKLKEKNT